MQKSRSKYTEGLYRIAEQWPFLRYLGLGAWWAWIWACYNGVALYRFWPDGPVAQRVGFMYLYSTPAIALALVLAGFWWRRITPRLNRRGLVLSLAAVASAGVLLIAFSPWLGGDAAFAVGGVLTGLGTSVLCLKTGQTYGTLGRHEVLTQGCFSLVFSALLYFMANGLPHAWQPVVVAALPLVSAALYLMPGDEDPFPADLDALAEPSRNLPGVRSYRRLVLASVMIAVTAGFGKGLAAVSMSPADFGRTGAVITFVIAVAALGICLIVNSGDIVRAVRRVYTLLILFGVVVALLSVFWVDIVYLNIGKELLWMVFTCLMAYTAFRFGFSPVRAFGFGQAAYLAASAAAWWAGMVCAPVLPGQAERMVVTGLMVFAIVGVFAFVFTDSDIKFLLTWHKNGPRSRHREDGAETNLYPSIAEKAAGPSDLQAAVADDDGLDTAAGTGSRGFSDEAAYTLQASGGGMSHSDGYAAMDATGFSVAEQAGERPLLRADVVRQYALSSRELEVLALFAQGRSANWIAESLTISNNTVRSHLRSAYVKLDVHTRQELIDFIAANRG